MRYLRTTRPKKCKLSAYHPGVFTKLNNMVFVSQTHLHFVLALHSSSLDLVFLYKLMVLA
jgi:hypothetical protein